MQDIFYHFWWLIFPLSWIVFGAFHSLMRYRRSRDAVDLAKQYVSQGKEPPAELMQSIAGKDPDEWGYWGRRGCRSRMPWPARLVFFGMLCAGFAYASYIDLYGASEAFGIVAFIMGAILAANLVAGLFSRMIPRD
jgi:hypothetical protein